MDGEGHVRERGSFETLNSTEGYVRSLDLKVSDMRKAAEADAASVEEELLEKEKAIAKIVSAKAVQEDSKKQTGSRGRRNKDSLLTYVKSMGNSWFAIFCFFTLANVGFRSAQGMCPLDLWSYHLTNHALRKALWLNVWTSANEANPDASVGYYVGIYALFGALNVIFMFAEFW